MPWLFLDFETYWDSSAGYTLKKLSVEEYVRDPRFEVLCLAWAYDDEPVSYNSNNIQYILSQLPFSDPTVCLHRLPKLPVRRLHPVRILRYRGG